MFCMDFVTINNSAIPSVLHKPSRAVGNALKLCDNAKRPGKAVQYDKQNEARNTSLDGGACAPAQVIDAAFLGSSLVEFDLNTSIILPSGHYGDTTF